MNDIDPPRRSTPSLAMLSLDDPDADVDSRCLHTAGGFAWWYAEVSDGAGNGVVVIWSFGLPFLPLRSGEAGAARSAAVARPSVNIAVYRAGQEAIYALHEVAPEEARWQPRRGGAVERWHVGESAITSRRVGDQTELQVQINVPVSGGERLRADLRLAGNTARWAGERRAVGSVGGPAPESALAHRWTPMVGAAFATARVRCGAMQVAVTGRAYHDRNAAPAPLESLGIDTWLWGRARTDDGDRVFYGLWPTGGGPPEVLAYELGATGAIVERTDLALELGQARRSRWGMPTWRGLTLTSDAGPWLRLTPAHNVDSGPFYSRHLCATGPGSPRDDSVHGTLEVIRPTRIHLARFRPLVRMRVSHSHRPSSPWLPLFEGAVGTRWRRLWRHWGERLRARRPTPARLPTPNQPRGFA